MSLNGVAPLSLHALNVLGALRAAPAPAQTINPGVVRKLLDESLAEIVERASPFRTHRGRNISHLKITDAGLKRWESEITERRGVDAR
jgi:hypothetical protein